MPNILKDNLGTLETYEDDDWRRLIEKGSYVTGLVLAVDDKYATIKIGTYRAVISASDPRMTCLGDAGGGATVASAA